MSHVGEYVLLLATLSAIYAFGASLAGAFSRSDVLVQSAERAIWGVCALLSIVSYVLMGLLISNDFGLAYIYGYSSRELPLFYKMSAFWAGQEGSLLLWGWMLSLFASIAIYQNRAKNRDMAPYVTLILSSTLLLFLLLIVVATPLFARLPYIPRNGFGLNPLLRNPGMVYHPPSLYIGFVSFAIPYAFAMAALIAKTPDARWLGAIRRWTIFSWIFLTIGNILGANWAYVELGWGGYWGWDPVENASFMPWLTATAFLHSIMIQERKSMLRAWNVILVTATFLLTILGTFITRSGIISSVHAFGESTVGPYFLGFLGIALLFSLGVILSRLEMLKSEERLESLVSREASFMFNNIILVGAALTVLLGTMFPLFSEFFVAEKITVGPPFFNRVMVPIGLALLFLTGICPLIAWRRSSVRQFRKNFLAPFIVALTIAIVLFVFGVDSVWAILALALAGFAFASITIDIGRGAYNRARNASDIGFLRALYQLASANKRRYGGHIVHIGAIALFVGFSGSAFTRSVEGTLFPGDAMALSDYKLTFKKFDHHSPAKDVEALAAVFLVEKRGRKIGYAAPELNLHYMTNLEGKRTEQYTSEVAIHTTLAEDLYLILSAYNADESGSFKVVINPLTQFIWIGTVLMVLGALLTVMPTRAREEVDVGARSTSSRSSRGEMKIGA